MQFLGPNIQLGHLSVGVGGGWGGVGGEGCLHVINWEVNFNSMLLNLMNLIDFQGTQLKS